VVQSCGMARPDFAPNRKDFKHQGRPEHLLWVHVNCQELLTDPLTDPQGTFDLGSGVKKGVRPAVARGLAATI
jgi:hypothetical protein